MIDPNSAPAVTSIPTARNGNMCQLEKFATMPIGQASDASGHE
jgi:hypothetical protein